MSVTITVDEAQAKLKDLIHQLVPGEEIIITENAQPVAKLVSEPAKPTEQRPAPGLGKGSIVYKRPETPSPTQPTNRSFTRVRLAVGLVETGEWATCRFHFLHAPTTTSSCRHSIAPAVRF